MSHHNDTVSRAVEVLDGHSPAPEAPIVSDQAASAAVSQAQARAFTSLARDIVAQIETEQARPLVPGKSGHRGTCRYHPNAGFPIRATRCGASEDVATHINQPGSHSVNIESVASESLSGAAS